MTTTAIKFSISKDEQGRTVRTPDLRDDEPVFVRRTVGIGNVWTHVETGVQIGKFPGQGFVVSVPVNGKHVDVVEEVAEVATYDRAHAVAVTTIARMMRLIAKAQAEALVEHFERFPLIADITFVVFGGRVRTYYGGFGVLLLSDDDSDPDKAIRVGKEAVWPASPVL